jgi:tubulin polyglutamylase TTLL6/13
MDKKNQYAVENGEPEGEDEGERSDEDDIDDPGVRKQQKGFQKQEIKRFTKLHSKKKKRLAVNLTGCKYKVLRDVCKFYNWEETDDEFEWVLYWTDTSVGSDRLKRMKSYQKINHFPGMSEITRKDALARVLLCFLSRNLYIVLFRI